MKKTCMALLAVVVLSAQAFCGNLSDIESLAAGSFPRGIAAADTDANGVNDLIVANFGEDTLIGQENDADPQSSVMIFSGNTRRDISAGKSPRGVAAGSIDQASGSDFAVSNYADGTVSIITEKGTKVTTLKAGKFPVGVAIGDINGDRKNDVAAAVYGENKVVAYINNGEGDWTVLETAVPGSPTDVIIGKLGGQDVIISANYTANSVSVIRYRSGALEKTADYPAGGGVCKVDLADVTGDNVPDVVAANFYDNTVSVLRQNAAGSLDSQAAYKLNGSRPNGMAVADMNGDGLLDVVTANRDSDTIDVLTQKDGALSVALSVTVTADEKKDFGPVEVAAADINGDGLADIAFTHMRSNTVRILYQVKTVSAADTKLSFAEQISEANTYNYPNPCVDSTVVRFSLSAASDVRVMITDLGGKPVWTKNIPASGTRPGINSVEWNVTNDFGARAANGTYLLKVFAEGREITKKIAVAK